MKAVLGLLLLAPCLAAHAGSIYLCKAYSGGTFWSQAHCNKHSALVESIVSVPDGIPWDQQVGLAEQQRRGAYQAPPPPSEVQHEQPAARTSQCKSLEAKVMQLDAMGRQPQSLQSLDWIRAERQSARNRQSELRC
jgi:hypothetical protein